jgi:hypothetical protein
MLLLPCDYRAGAGLSHPHSLLQLWLDAADGTIAHDHADGLGSVPPMAIDDAGHAHDTGESPSSQTVDRHPDVGEHLPSAPVVSGLHVLTIAIALFPALIGSQGRPAETNRLLVGRHPRVLVPPPRKTGPHGNAEGPASQV